MDKAERLKLLKKIGQKHTDQEAVAFGGFPATRAEITDEVGRMDTFQEAVRESSAERINSDEM